MIGTAPKARAKRLSAADAAAQALVNVPPTLAELQTSFQQAILAGDDLPSGPYRREKESRCCEWQYRRGGPR